MLFDKNNNFEIYISKKNTEYYKSMKVSLKSKISKKFNER